MYKRQQHHYISGIIAGVCYLCRKYYPK
ncbi:glycosyltransferase family 8 C-terminal domain-containing protein [Escherichia coli]|nr:glycosyltransferase family 8 C-terminal domain-containing protein [Escherichia coli]